jgi:hypothetical protein
MARSRKELINKAVQRTWEKALNNSIPEYGYLEERDFSGHELPGNPLNHETHTRAQRGTHFTPSFTHTLSSYVVAVRLPRFNSCYLQ